MRNYLPDRVDQALIALLRGDGRAPVSKLADILQVSRATVQARLDRMLENGTILGFTVRARETASASTIRAITFIEVEGRSTSMIIRSMRGIVEITSLHTTNGAWDLVAEIEAENLADFDRVLGQIRMIDGVLNSETSILLRSVH